MVTYKYQYHSLFSSMIRTIQISKQAIILSIVAVLVSVSVLLAVFVPRQAHAAIVIDGCSFDTRADYIAYKKQLNSGGIFQTWCNGFPTLTQIKPSGHSSYPTPVTSTIQYIPGSSR